MQPEPFSRWIPAIALVLFGCYAPMAQHSEAGQPEPLHVVANAPAYVLFDGDSTVRYAKIRLVADTLYGWEYQQNRAPKDSVAIAAHRIRAIEQNRLDVPATVVAAAAARRPPSLSSGAS
ncbi:hypothetical protein BH09GEM1_BH09GEM1_25660 [soil metagenome]